MKLSWSIDREGGVSLVRCRLHNDEAVRRRVRVRSRLDGPVFPPRRGGVPEAGWDADGVTVRLAADERRALGFASPASPSEPPVEMHAVDATESGEDGSEPSAATAVRDLGAYRPPRDAVVTPTRDADGRVGGTGRNVSSDPSPDRRTDADDPPESETGTESEERDPETAEPSPTESDPHLAVNESGSTSAAPAKIDDWLDAVERRIERGERLVDADVATATEVVVAAGGVEALTDLDVRLDDDAARLRRLGERASSLAARAERADVPTEALRRLS